MKILVEQWLEHYGAPQEVHLDEDVCIRSDTGWYKLVLDPLNVFSSTGYTTHEPFHGGRPAWLFKTPFPQDYKSLLGDWLKHRQDPAALARADLEHVRERDLTRRNRTRGYASLKVGDLVPVNLS